MALPRRGLVVVGVAAMLLACGNAAVDGEPLGEARQALNACNETVPALRAVDGFPAYAQCSGIEDGAIWSNNGIDTAASSQGAGWVKTQYSGGYQCTELARRYNMFRWGIDYQHGNAGEWCDGALPSTLVLATSPTHGDLIVFAPGSCGADATTGHIAIVDTVDTAGGKVTIVEQNQAGRRSTAQSCAKCFLHAVANDGSAGGGGHGGSSSAGSSTGGSSNAGSSAGGSSNAGSSFGGGGNSAGSTPSGAGAPSGAGTSSSAPSAGGSDSGGPAVTGGSNSASGAPPVSSSSGGGEAGGGHAGTPDASDQATSDDAGCSVARVAHVADAPTSTSLALLGLALLSRSWRRPRRTR